MGKRRLTLAALPVALIACGPPAKPVAVAPSPPPVQESMVQPPAPATMAERVVADFETAIKSSREAYVALFDFHAVGEMEILLHRYDLLGRLDDLSDDVKAQFAGEGADPYPPERERTNVTGFFTVLGQRTVGSGGCRAIAPRTEYAKLLATFEPLPPGALIDYEPLRQKALGYVAKGGLVSLRCDGGKGGVALVWTERPNARGYDLITIYDD